MIKKINSLFKKRFIQDTTTLQVGTLFSTGLGFISSIIFARFLGAEKYGIYALIFAFTNFINLFKNWGQGHANLTILSEAWARKDREEIKKITIFYIKIAIITCLTISLSAIIFAPYLAKIIYQNQIIGRLARLILLGGCLQFVYLLILNILQASRKIKHLAILENINKIIYIILPIIFILLGFGLKGVVWGHFIAAFLFFIFSIYFYRILYNRTRLLPTFREIVKNFNTIPIKKYFRFGFLIAIDKNLSALYSILPLNLLGAFVASQEIAYFKVALSYVSLTLIFIKPISRLLNVQLPRSKIYGLKELKKHFFKTAIYSFVIVLITLIPMLFLAKTLVLLFYGSEYTKTIKIIYLLWPFVAFSALGVGIGSIFRTLNKMKVAIIINLSNIIIGLPIIYYLIKSYGILGMIIVTIFWSSISTIISLFYIKKYFNINIKK